MRAAAFGVARAIASFWPGGRIAAFGAGKNRIGSIIVVNLNRQPKRWRRVLRELSRFKTFDGAPLVSITRRFAAVDARDGCAVAATADVDSIYRIGDQLYVQPDSRLSECFGADEPIRMTRQEVAIARSHIEVWKSIVGGGSQYVLILEDDVWFRSGAASAIDRCWNAAIRRFADDNGPHLLYLSYSDAGGTVDRADACDILFRPVRGLWFLSGYVLSQLGAAALLRAMPVVGPVDLWVNYRFAELRALAISSPVILQRNDCASDNSHSVLPYLARAGIVDASAGPSSPSRAAIGPIFAWTAESRRESLAMALSMLGLRVRAFDSDEKVAKADGLAQLFEVFDVVVDAPIAPGCISIAIGWPGSKFILEASADRRANVNLEEIPTARRLVLSGERSWEKLCAFLGLQRPPHAFPLGTSRRLRMFRDDRPKSADEIASLQREEWKMDESPWVLPPSSRWRLRAPSGRHFSIAGTTLIRETMSAPAPSFRVLVETFPGNQASFSREGVVHDNAGTRLAISKSGSGGRPYRSGALASRRSFKFGRFEVEIKAARGPGRVTGFFLYREAPRQEIDIELAGEDPHRMLVNVYFNPGDNGAALAYGYRGSPCSIALGFDATAEFHRYAIDWRPGRILWLVDDTVVHERMSWDPTPIPHLSMHLHANLWIPRSEDLAGRLDLDVGSREAVFRNLAVMA